MPNLYYVSFVDTIDWGKEIGISVVPDEGTSGLLPHKKLDIELEFF